MGTGRVIALTIPIAVLTSAAMFFGLRALTAGRPAGAAVGGGTFAGDEVEVPPLVGLRSEQARKLLDPRGLLLTITEGREDPRVDPGQVAQQTPLEGSRVRRGGEVRVVLSTGAARVEVPALARQPLAAATQLLTGAGLQPGPVTRQPHAVVPAEQVISSTPAAGERLARGAAVALVVSAGSADEVRVPSLLGKKPAQAAQLLGAAGLKLGRTSFGFDEDRRGGVVIRQTPAADAPAAKGSAVNVVINESD